MDKIEKAEAALLQAEAERDAAVADYFAKGVSVSVAIGGAMRDAVTDGCTGSTVYVITKSGARVGRHYSNVMKKGE